MLTFLLISVALYLIIAGIVAIKTYEDSEDVIEAIAFGLFWLIPLFENMFSGDDPKN